MGDIAVLRAKVEDQTRAGVNSVVGNFERMSRASSQVTGKFQELKSRTFGLGTAFQALGAALTVRQVVAYADAWTRSGNQLRLVTTSQENLGTMMERVFSLSQQTRSSFDATSSLYARLARSTTELGLSQSDMLRITRAVNQGFIISGASTQEASSAVMQLGQAFASGTLRGDELRSVLENAPRLATAISTALGITVGDLRKLGEEGKLTSKTLAYAILQQSTTLDSEFGTMSSTVGESFMTLGNSFERLVGKFNEGTEASKMLVGGLNGVVGAVEWLATALAKPDFQTNLDKLMILLTAGGAAKLGMMIGGVPGAGVGLAVAAGGLAYGAGDIARGGAPVDQSQYMKSKFGSYSFGPQRPPELFPELATPGVPQWWETEVPSRVIMPTPGLSDAEKKRLAEERQKQQAQAWEWETKRGSGAISLQMKGMGAGEEETWAKARVAVSVQSLNQLKANEDELAGKRNEITLGSIRSEDERARWELKINQDLELSTARKKQYTAEELTGLQQLQAAERDLLKARLREADVMTKVGQVAQAFSGFSRELDAVLQTGTQLAGSVLKGDVFGVVVSGLGLVAHALFGVGDASQRAAEQAADARRKLLQSAVSATAAISGLPSKELTQLQYKAVSPLLDLFNTMRAGGPDRTFLADYQSFLSLIQTYSKEDWATRGVEMTKPIMEMTGLQPVSGPTAPGADAWNKMNETIFAALGVTKTGAGDIDKNAPLTILKTLSEAFGPESTLQDITLGMFGVQDAMTSLQDSSSAAAKSLAGLGESAAELLAAEAFQVDVLGARKDLAAQTQWAGSDVFAQKRAMETFGTTLEAIQSSITLAKARAGTGDTGATGAVVLKPAGASGTTDPYSLGGTIALTSWDQVVTLPDAATRIRVNFGDAIQFERATLGSWNDLLDTGAAVLNVNLNRAGGINAAAKYSLSTWNQLLDTSAAILNVNINRAGAINADGMYSLSRWNQLLDTSAAILNVDINRAGAVVITPFPVTSWSTILGGGVIAETLPLGIDLSGTGGRAKPTITPYAVTSFDELISFGTMGPSGPHPAAPIQVTATQVLAISGKVTVDQNSLVSWVNLKPWNLTASQLVALTPASPANRVTVDLNDYVAWINLKPWNLNYTSLMTLNPARMTVDLNSFLSYTLPRPFTVDLNNILTFRPPSGLGLMYILADHYDEYQNAIAAVFDNMDVQIALADVINFTATGLRTKVEQVVQEGLNDRRITVPRGV